MRVKVGDTVYNARDLPIMIVFDGIEEKQQVQDMHPGAMKYAQCPDGWNEDHAREWMSQGDVGEPCK